MVIPSSFSTLHASLHAEGASPRLYNPFPPQSSPVPSRRPPSSSRQCSTSQNFPSTRSLYTGTRRCVAGTSATRHPPSLPEAIDGGEGLRLGSRPRRPAFLDMRPVKISPDLACTSRIWGTSTLVSTSLAYRCRGSSHRGLYRSDLQNCPLERWGLMTVLDGVGTKLCRVDGRWGYKERGASVVVRRVVVESRMRTSDFSPRQDAGGCVPCTSISTAV